MLFCVLVIYLSGIVNAKKCSDCISISSCQEAVSVVNSIEYGERDALYRVKNALCGFKGYDAQVCCSYFPITMDPIVNHWNAALLPEKCGTISSDVFIDSPITKLYEFPWMALISVRSSDGGLYFKCGGTIINSRYILTSTSCVYPTERVAGVRIGEYDISTKYDCEGYDDDYICESNIQDMRVEKIIIHEKFNYTTTPEYDIALVRLKKSIDLTKKNAAPICLPLTRALRGMTLEGQTATVAGWVGSTGHGSNRLSKFKVPINMEGDCLNYTETTRKIICAGDERNDACHGDGGGPLMLEGEYKGVNRYIQYGIVSYGPRQCGSSKPGVYTDVTKFLRWILNKIEQ